MKLLTTCIPLWEWFILAVSCGIALWGWYKQIQLVKKVVALNDRLLRERDRVHTAWL